MEPSYGDWVLEAGRPSLASKSDDLEGWLTVQGFSVRDVRRIEAYEGETWIFLYKRDPETGGKLADLRREVLPYPLPPELKLLGEPLRKRSKVWVSEDKVCNCTLERETGSARVSREQDAVFLYGHTTECVRAQGRIVFSEPLSCICGRDS